MGMFGFFQKKKEAPGEAFQEKRLLPRWKISSAVKIKWEGRNSYLAGEVKDLNMKGCSLILAEKIPQGCSRIELYFNEKFFFNLETAVIWHKEADGKLVYGIKFTKVRDPDKDKFFQMMRENFSGQMEKNLWGK